MPSSQLFVGRNRFRRTFLWTVAVFGGLGWVAAIGTSVVVEDNRHQSYKTLLPGVSILYALFAGGYQSPVVRRSQPCLSLNSDS